MTERRSFFGTTVECVRGDIACQPGFDAVVNAANPELRPGGGVAGALHAAAGPGLEEQCRAFAPIRPGQAVITGAHSLPNRHVIHCLGPVYGVHRPGDRLLASCYRNALRLADRHRLSSIAFPAVSTGAYGYPVEAAARIALHTVLDEIFSLVHLVRIRFVLYHDISYRRHVQVMDQLLRQEARRAR